MMFIRCDFLLHYFQANRWYPTFEITFFRAFQQLKFKSMLSLHNVNSHWCCTWWYNMSTYVCICLCPSLSLWQVSSPLAPKRIIRRDTWPVPSRLLSVSHWWVESSKAHERFMPRDRVATRSLLKCLDSGLQLLRRSTWSINVPKWPQ